MYINTNNAIANIAVLLYTTLEKVMNIYLQVLKYLPPVPTSLQDASSIRTGILLLCPLNISNAHTHVQCTVDDHKHLFTL